MSIHVDHPSPGVATVSLGPGRRLTYRADPDTHRVTVHDDFGRLMLAFGGRGAGTAALDTPLDLAFVRPLFSGEHLPLGGPDAVWLAVADYGNHRIQVFELDGAHVGAVDLADHPGLGAPCALSWRAPVLEIEGVEGARARIYLSAALLSSAVPLGPAERPLREWRHASALVN